MQGRHKDMMEEFGLRVMEFVIEQNVPLIQERLRALTELASIKGVVKAAVNERDELQGKVRAMEQGVDVKWRQVRYVLAAVVFAFSVATLFRLRTAPSNPPLHVRRRSTAWRASGATL